MRRIFLLLALTLAPLLARGGSVVREEGSVYLEDVLKKPVKLTVLADSPIFFDAAMKRYLGTLRKGQEVQLLAVMDKAYRVRGMAQQGQVAGWLEIKNLSPLNEKFVADLKKSAERTAQVRELIEKHEVAINMTPDEVTQSLGKPQKRSARVDAEGRHDVWEYIHYEYVQKEVAGTDQFGRLVNSIVTVKVPNGKISVVFEDGLVSAIEQSEGNLIKGSGVRTVIQPLTVAP